MKFFDLKSAQSFFVLLKSLNNRVALVLLTFFNLSGMLIIFLGIMGKTGILPNQIAIRITSLVMALFGLFTFFIGLIPVVVNKARPLYLKIETNYSECVSAFVAISAIGFVFFFIGLARLLMGF